MILTYDNYLKHYGIKGMKWGVRREEGPDGNVSSGSGKKDVAKSDPSKEAKGSSESSSRSSRGKKIAASAAVGAAIAGVAVAGIAVSRNKRARDGKKVAENLKRVQGMSKMSAADLFLNSQPAPTKTSRRDTKVFGDKGANRVARNRDRGMSPSDARKMEALQQGAAFALKAGLNVATSSRRRS